MSVTVTIKCPDCGKNTEIQMTENEYGLYSAVVQVQQIFPHKDAFFREVLISHWCYDCQSRIFHRPKPGEDWGAQLRSCPNCDAPVYKKDLDKGSCSCCGYPLSRR